MRLVFDSDALIKLTKAGLKELIVTNLDIAIPKRVYEETVKIPRGRRFPDAEEIEGNVNSGKIQVNETQREKKGGI
ncbi:hypothetical protein [Geoglobus acetivorans]|uniref:PIN domain-containing protein n=1 Tax=Geoglobus acetivorans TaxID=565033 RepID=A0ABZ3H516_GEOAI|nr:hypothetical protein [Geoglobus acetivorans]